MEFLTSFGGLVPLWILGAPLIAGVVSMMTTPKVQTTTRDDRVRPMSQPMAHPMAQPAGAL